MADPSNTAPQQPGQPLYEPVAAKTATPTEALGAVLAILMDSPRHAGMSLSLFARHVAPAIERGQFTILGKNQSQSGPAVAVAWWALVSPEVEKRFATSRDPFITLRPADWRSGPQPWIIDAVGDQKAVDELIKRLLFETFTKIAPKMRAILPDGRIVAGKLEARPAASTGKPPD